MKEVRATDAADQVRGVDTLAIPLGPGQPPDFLQALGERERFEDLSVFGALLIDLFPLFTRPGVTLHSGFYGPAERVLRDAGHAVCFVPADFRRFTRLAQVMKPRVMVTAATPPDAGGWCSLSLHAGATVEELQRCGRDPDRVLIVEANAKLPFTLGLLPEHPHALHVDQIDYLIRSDRDVVSLPEIPPSDVEQAIAKCAAEYVCEGATLQTGIGGVPNAVAEIVSTRAGGDYGIHSEMFTTGLMKLHRAGKVSNLRKGVHEGYSVTTFALGNRELYDWLDGEGRDLVRFLPVDAVNTPALIARNRKLISINGALSVDLFGQVVADEIDGKEHSGIGGHEDFVTGAAFSEGGRSLICLPSTAGHAGNISRIVSRFPAGTCVTTPRHQVDVIITEYGAAELAGLTTSQRREALVEIAHPDFRDELARAARRE
ncbi:MAG: 4-hydroxybutyrate CoA-transferase [bacterium]|nr:4-hydroxybutyrate CoA-transferase [bacterium]